MTSAAPSREALVARFTALLERVGGRVTRVPGSALAACVGEILAEHGVGSVAVSDAPVLHSVCERLPASTAWLVDPDDATLLDVDCGLCTAQWGIAETGTLVLVSDAERHRRVSLVPPGHVAILETSQLVPDLDAALATWSGDAMPATVTFITGPSRTADIELTLVVGVHGPRWLHVVLVDADRPNEE